ncbi:hypothetical protein OUZ56_032307 [Daphnia magna]|uniref:Uncharacterized protein n=1 Tax=Daphnia magna TaxID=35525 RepID=A0ABQ9ZWS1_9CRUS|nr:hypothetical protein OUZ56_032307 [Daphnia magna]
MDFLNLVKYQISYKFDYILCLIGYVSVGEAGDRVLDLDEITICKIISLMKCICFEHAIAKYALNEKISSALPIKPS